MDSEGEMGLESKDDDLERISGRIMSTLSVVMLTVGLGGLQGIFAVQLSNGPAYLKTLGLSKPMIALVWMTGPLSGTIMQPYFGICSDQCQSPWGKRRPYIFFGAVAIILSLMGLAWAESLTDTIALALSLGHQAHPLLAQMTAVLFVLTLNVSIQPVQGGLRALIVDTCPRSQQQVASAWAGRVAGLANVCMHILAYTDLTQFFPWLGTTQFRILCAIAASGLVVTILLTCVAVHEQLPTLKTSIEHKETILSKMSYLCTRYHRLPLQIQRVFMAQFCAWMGWFPFLLNITTYIGDTYQSLEVSGSHRSLPGQANRQDKATRAGLLGLLIFSLVSFITSILLPLLVCSKVIDERDEKQVPIFPPSRWEVLSTWFCSMRSLWIMSHLLFACCMFATIITSTVEAIYVLVALSGISWAVTIWAPFAIIGMHISDDPEVESEAFRMDAAGIERRPGIVLGLHNVAIAAPQIIAAAFSSIIFRLLDGTEARLSSDSVGWVLRVAGVCALAAALLARNVCDEEE